MSAKRNSFANREEFDKAILDEIAAKNKPSKVQPLTQGQADLVDIINDCQITICSGPAGTGKTHLAIGLGLEGLHAGKYDQFMLLRPIQECGNKLGAFPGEKDEKINPYMKAIYQLFTKFITEKELEKYIREERIVIDCAEFYRGCTFDDMFVVMDESQNFMYSQLKMLVTRIGDRSKMVFVGDERQTDLPKRLWYGYDDGPGCARVPYQVFGEKMDNVDDDDVGSIELTREDIVRNGLITKILDCLEGPQ